MTPYSPIRHLAHALFLNHDSKSVLMAIFTAYFDASASEKAIKLMTIAGFVSTEDKWRKFEDDWNDVLRKYGVPYLHMKEFTCSRKAFETWEGDEVRRKAFIIDLLKVAKSRVHKGFSCTVRLDHYKEINQRFRLHEHWGNPYSFVGMGAMSAVMRWKEKRFPHDRIKYIFEGGDKGRNHLENCLKSEQLPYAFIPKKEKQDGRIVYIRPFEIADFAAWENRAVFDRLYEGRYQGTIDDPLKSLRGSYRALYRQIPANWMTVAKNKLEALCESLKLRR